MNKIKFILTILILSSVQLLSQGFDWQYSIRFPSNSPKFFVGASSSKIFSTGTSDISFSELYIPCCSFSSPVSDGFSFGLNAEYWLNSGVEAISLSMNFRKNNFNLKATPDPVFYKNDTLYTEIINDNIINYFDVSGLYKYRINNSHFSLSAGIMLNILLSNYYKVRENVISLDDTFNNGETSREIINGSTNDLSKIIISPIIRVNYDLSIVNSIYSTFYADFGVNLNSMIKDDSWRNYQFSIGIAFYFGFIFLN